METEEMLRESEEMIRRVMAHHELVIWLLAGIVTVLTVIVGIFAVLEHREKMKNLRMIRRTMEDRDIRYKSAYAPTFTGEVEESNGKTFYRMGPPREKR